MRPLLLASLFAASSALTAPAVAQTAADRAARLLERGVAYDAATDAGRDARPDARWTIRSAAATEGFGRLGGGRAEVEFRPVSDGRWASAELPRRRSPGNVRSAPALGI